MQPNLAAHCPNPHDAPGTAGVPLSSLGAGDRATVHCRLLAAQDSELLCAMGMSDRCPLRVCRVGGACIVEVAGTRLALSECVASRVMVIPAQPGRGAA